MGTEKIKFEFWFDTSYWNNPPSVQIYIDDNIMLNKLITFDNNYLSFDAVLEFGPHTLKLVRQGKTDDESKQTSDGSWATQSLILSQLKIDGIDVRNHLWHYSKFYPVYSQSYAAQNKNLETEITGELFFGHNGTWIYNFVSPFYSDVVQKVRGYV